MKKASLFVTVAPVNIRFRADKMPQRSEMEHTPTFAAFVWPKIQEHFEVQFRLPALEARIIGELLGISITPIGDSELPTRLERGESAICPEIKDGKIVTWLLVISEERES